MNKIRIISIVLIILIFLVGALVYPLMPSKMASHWNTQGEVDGYMPKFWGVFLMPLTCLILFALFIFLPRIDPLKRNYAKFRQQYNGFILAIIAFLGYLYIITLLWNVEMRFSINQLLIPAFAALFFYAGILIDKAKRNWFVGIRTPWTLSSQKVWDKTHQLGGQLFKLSAIIALLGLLSESLAIYLMIGPIILASIYLFVYSYWIFQKEKKH